MSNCMLFQDPPRHTRLRSAVIPSLTASATRSLRPFIERRVKELLEPFAKGEPFDFIREVAVPFPLDIIGDLLGVPASERATFRVWSAALRDGVDRPKWGSDALARAEAATLALREYFEGAWNRHRREPKESVLDDLFRLEGRESGLSKDEAFGTFVLLISAGHETTTNMLGNGMYLFSRHPGERERLLDRPSLVPRAVDEILRFESPVQMIPRFVAEDFQLGDRKLLRGQHLEIMVGSANRDPAIFEEPERFNVARTPNPHLTFSTGTSHCIGASIARTIGSMALPFLLNNVRALDFPSGEAPWSKGARFHGLTDLQAVMR
jgi:cytochrome P450